MKNQKNNHDFSSRSVSFFKIIPVIEINLMYLLSDDLSLSLSLFCFVLNSVG